MQISWLRTEYAHEVFALTDLLEQRVVSFLQARLFLKEDFRRPPVHGVDDRSEEHTSELQSLGESRMPSSA